MKVSEGLVGVTLNPNARTNFFLIAPELAQDAKKVAETTLAKEGSHHHTLSTPVMISREEKNIEQVITTIQNFTNPFIEQSNGLFHVVTKVVMPSKDKKDLLEQSEIGQKLFETFVKDRIKSGNINRWSSMKKRKLQTWKTTGKKIKVSSAGLACVAGGISVEVLYCFGGGAARRVGIQVNFGIFPRGFLASRGRSAAKKVPRAKKSCQPRRLVPVK